MAPPPLLEGGIGLLGLVGPSGPDTELINIYMDEIVQEIPLGERVFIRGDFNGHVGSNRMGNERVHGGFGTLRTPFVVRLIRSSIVFHMTSMSPSNSHCVSIAIFSKTPKASHP